MLKRRSVEELKEKHAKVLSNKAILSISKAKEPNTDTRTDEEKYLADAKRNVSGLKGRIRSIIESSNHIKELQ